MTTVLGGLVYPVEGLRPSIASTPEDTSETITWSRGSVQVLDLTEAAGDVTVEFADPADGGVYHLVVVRDGGGNGIAAWPANIRWFRGEEPTLQVSNNGAVYDHIQLVYNAAADLYVARDLTAPEPAPRHALLGVVDFGTGSDFAEVSIPIFWVIATPVAFIPSVQTGTDDHPVGDEDAAIEQLHAVILSSSEEEVTVGVHAPNGTWGQYVVTVIAMGGEA